MMRLFLFYSLFLVPFTTVLAQNDNNSSAASAQVTVFTSFSTGSSLDQNRQTVAFSTAFPVTLTLTANSPNATGNSTNSNSTSTNSTSTNSTSTKSTSTAPLPTAPTDVNGGGGGPNGAPSPGQTGQGGVYGPPDGYVSGVTSLQWNAIFVGITGAIIGALLSLL